MLHRRSIPFLGAMILLVTGLAANALAVDVPLHDWPAPAAWSSSAAQGAKVLLTETNPLPLVAVTPCRIADTRNAAGPYGAPALAANMTRNFTITGVCGIPSSAHAVSINFTVVNMNTNGNLIAWPQGAAVPTTSSINWNASSVVLANSAVVQLGAGGGMSVRPNTPVGASVDLIIDINGYYYDNNLGDMAIGEYFGVVGSYNSGGVLFAWNHAATASGSSGLNAASNSSGTGSAAVHAVEVASSGVVYGVMGQIASTSAQAAGVYGVDSSGSAGSAGYILPAGVSGSSSTGYGGFFSSRNIASKHVFINSDASQGAVVYLADGANAIEAAGNLVVSGTKSFVDPHPGDPSRTIAYVALEGPEAGTYFRGRGRIHNGVGTIEVPESFRLVSDEEGLTVQVTPIGQAANVAVTSYDLNSVSVKSSVRELEFFYVVNGVRRNFKNFDPMTAAPFFFIPEGPGAQMSSALSEGQRAALIANGTYNPDGTVNMKTAEAAGWTKTWAAKEAEAKALAAARRKGHEEPAQAKDIGHDLRTN